jgi:preprotein translocase subunit SecY
MLQALSQAIRIPELRRKLLFTLMLLLIFRVLASISVPGANAQALQQLFAGNNLLGLLNLFSGGGLSTFSIVAMGMNPYINATIIMQLMTVVSLRLKELSKEGEQGRKRITRYTRWLTVALAALQAYGYTVLFTSRGVLSSPSAGTVIEIIITLTAGSVILMWLGELITEYGVGNGVSLVIFSGIIGRLPGAIYTYGSTGGTAHILSIIGMGIVAVVVTAFIIEVQQAVRKIPIQSAQRVVGGSRTIQARQSFLPLRVNTAGVIPIIFAISIMFFPTIIANYFSAAPTGTWYYNAAQWVRGNFVPDGPNLSMDILYNALYFVFVFGFTYFYTAITFDVNDVANSLRRYSSFIPGIRPGRPTADYLGAVLNRVTFAGAVFLGLVTVVLPLATSGITGIPHQQMYLGGTAILIVVGVALDTMKQLETQLIMRQYRGFIR